jgi:hypothetical protein
MKDNHIKYVNREREGYISIYRISGYDLSLAENAVQNQIFEECSRFWGHHSDFDIISLGVKYQIPTKQYKLKKTNTAIKQLQALYDAQINKINSDTKNKQNAYFLILNGSSIEDNEERFAVLERLIREAKINLSAANASEISQILNTL